MSNSEVNWIWMTPKWPLPPEDGARQATFHLIRGLTEKGAKIHLCAIVPRDSEIAEPERESARKILGVTKVTCLPKKNPTLLARAWSLLSDPFTPLTVAPYGSREIARAMDAVLESEPKDSIIVFDGLHTAAWISHSKAFKTREKTSVYRAHNVEKDLWRQSAEKARNPALKALFWFQAWAMARFEHKVSASARYVAAVSDLDRQRLVEAYAPRKCETVPIGIRLPEKSQLGFPDKKEILFLGRLDWPPNRDGLVWFLDNIWPEAAQASPDLSLVIAGAGNGDWISRYLSLASHPRIKFLGRVVELAPLYQKTVASIVPIFLGSGTRVKAIEASSFSRPCISTSIGVEGIGLDPAQSYFLAENRAQWLTTLKDLSLAEAKLRGERAYEHIARSFDPGRIAEKFQKGVL